MKCSACNNSKQFGAQRAGTDGRGGGVAATPTPYPPTHPPFVQSLLAWEVTQ